MPPPISGLNDLQDNRGDAHGPQPIGPKPGGNVIIKAAADPRTITVATAAAVALIATNIETRYGQIAFKAMTGFKPPVVSGGGVAKPTPFALALLAPQPIGVLPERFFQGKPQIPGTNIYFDPIYTATQYLERRDQRKFNSAREEFTDAFRFVLPSLPDDDVSLLVRFQDLKREHIPLIDPLFADQLLREELERRRLQRQSEQARERQRRIDQGLDQFTDEELGDFGDGYFAYNPPDP